jgi:D-xylose transport system substrate-binding protein
MRTKMFALVAVGVVTLGVTAACTDDNGGSGGAGSGTRGGSGSGKVGVILPDTTSSQRWGTDDPKFLKAAFDAAEVPLDIQNAQGDKAKFQQIADGMIASGVKVLMTANLDPAVGKAVLAKAKAAGIKTIDYDRLTLNGGADYYVSFDNVEVGRLQGKGLIKCLEQKDAELATALETRFDELQVLLDAQRTDEGFVYYDELSQAEIKDLSDAVNALSEPLSRLTAAVLS